MDGMESYGKKGRVSRYIEMKNKRLDTVVILDDDAVLVDLLLQLITALPLAKDFFSRDLLMIPRHVNSC